LQTPLTFGRGAGFALRGDQALLEGAHEVLVVRRTCGWGPKALRLRPARANAQHPGPVTTRH
jgi:hypothetical protein